MKPIRIVGGGVSSTGKSTFMCSLYIALQLEGISVGLHELDVYSDTHGPLLGLKGWDERHKRVFAKYRQTIRPAIDSFEADAHAIILGDLPGKLANPWLSEMVARADYAVLIGRERVERDATARHPQSAGDWEHFFCDQGIPLISRVQSMLSGQAAWEGTISATGLNRALQPLAPSVQLVMRRILRLGQLGRYAA
jgi:hypothetical protein